MPRSASHFRQSDVERAVKAARNAGMDVSQVEITKDGTIRVMVIDDSNEKPIKTADNPWDETLQ